MITMKNLPSAYLWARCEGWVKIGVFHAVIVDDSRGEVTDEKSGLLLRREADGLWIEPAKEPPGKRYDRIAVTHLPVDPWVMSAEGWEERRADKEARLRQRSKSRRTEASAAPGLFDEPIRGGESDRP